MPDPNNSQYIVRHVQAWIKDMVIGLNLCPFAAKVINCQSIHYTVSSATTPEQLLFDLAKELDRTGLDDAIETALLVHPQVLEDFTDYNQFLDYADALLQELGLEGIYQIASFHPDYCFADSLPGDLKNYTNRSPYPMLHILKEESVSEAVRQYPGAEQIPAINSKKLEKTGHEKLLNIIATLKPAAY